MSDKYYQSLGRRKTAVAQVRLFPGGSGKFTVNGRDVKDYFNSEEHVVTATLALKELGKLEDVDVTVRAIGGGQTGQADAISLGVSRALVKLDEELKKSLRSHGLMTRDARKKERKKFGRHGARRSPQWRKR